MVITSKPCARRYLHHHNRDPVLVVGGLQGDRTALEARVARVALCHARWCMGQLRSVGEVGVHRSCPRGKGGELVAHSRRRVGHGHVEESDQRKGQHRGGRSSRVVVGYDDGSHHGEGCNHEEVHGGSSRLRREVVHVRSRRHRHHGGVEESANDSGHEVEAYEGSRSECRRRNERWRP